MEYDSIEGLPEEFEGAWFTKDELKKRNKDLEKYGKRICHKHQGKALLLKESFRLRKSNGYVWYDNVCKNCRYQEDIARTQERYHKDKKFREAYKKRRRDDYAADPEPKKQREKNRRDKAKKEGLLRSFGRLLS